MPTIQHLLETRFSVRLGATAPSRAWLEQRVRLLRRFCLPSVAAQTAADFTWLLFCDEATDPEILAELRSEERRVPTLRIALTSATRSPLDVVRSTVTEDSTVLITTRLDSDDAIADRYLEAVQDYASAFQRSTHDELLINFPRGYRLDVQRERLYRGWMPNSPFHSFFERPRNGPAKSVMSAGHDNLRQRYETYKIQLRPEGTAGWHVQLHQHYPTHQDESITAWTMVVHGGNLTNRIHSTVRELPAGTQPQGFTLAEPLAHRDVN